MNPVDVDLHLFAIGKFLDGKGKKPSEEQHNRIVAFIEAEMAAHPDEADLKTTLNSVKTMWDVVQTSMPPTKAGENRGDVHEDVEKIGTALGKKHGMSKAGRALKKAVNSSRTDADKIRKLASGKNAGKEESNNYGVPGPRSVAIALAEKNIYKTVKEPENRRRNERVYQYMEGFYVPAEELIAANAHTEWVTAWEKIRDMSTDKDTIDTAEKALRKGPTQGFINEVIDQIRRTTFVDPDTINPGGYIPFANGLLNLNTRKLEPFTPELFFVYGVNAEYINRPILIDEIPQFYRFMASVFDEHSLALVLSYFGYTLYPGFPVHKVLLILGRERVGKGTAVRILRGLLGSGYGSIQLSKLLVADRFMFTGIIGKKVLVDAEIKRTFRKGTDKDWKAFNELFGSDAVQYEAKGQEGVDYVSKAKGIFIGNLPFFHVDNAAAASRILLVETRNEKPKKVITDLDDKILGAERNEIAVFLIQALFSLIDAEFHFPDELDTETTMEKLDLLADPVANFIEERVETVEGVDEPADDVYHAFLEWCNLKGIPSLTSQTFKSKFGFTFKKKITGPRGNRIYVFSDCSLAKSEIGIDRQEKLNAGSNEVDHGNIAPESLKNTGFEDWFKRDQHGYNNPDARKHEHEIHERYNKDHVPKLITENDSPETGEILPPANTKCVINLHGKTENPPNFDENNAQNEEKSSDSNDLKKTPGTQDTVAFNEKNAETSDHGSEKITKSQPDPANSAETPVPDAISNENPVTIDQGKDMIGQLLNPGYHVSHADSGTSINGKFFKIAVTKPVDVENNDRLLRQLQTSGFRLANTGAIGPLIFMAPLRREGT
jgi:phage/plasmid-associated DNA primase